MSEATTSAPTPPPAPSAPATPNPTLDAANRVAVSGEKRGSCAPCRRSHAGCDGLRPCRRCITNGTEANCADQPPGTAPSRSSRPPSASVGPLGEGEGPPCPSCPHNAKSNPTCVAARCRRCCNFAQGQCSIHRDEPAPALALRPRHMPALRELPSAAPAASVAAPISGASAVAILAAQQGGIPLQQAHHSAPKEATAPAGPPPPFRLGAVRSMCDQYIYNPEPSMIRPTSTAAHSAVIATCPACGREVSRLGSALWAHIAQCNPELFHAYIAGELESEGASDGQALVSQTPASIAAAAAKSAAAERWAHHTTLLEELFAPSPSVEAIAGVEVLSQSINCAERQQALQRIVAIIDRMADLRPKARDRADVASKRSQQFWSEYEGLSSLSLPALKKAAASLPQPPPAPFNVRAHRVTANTAKRKREAPELVQL